MRTEMMNELRTTDVHTSVAQMLQREWESNKNGYIQVFLIAENGCN